jgi:hypothetical protein
MEHMGAYFTTPRNKMQPGTKTCVGIIKRSIRCMHPHYHQEQRWRLDVGKQNHAHTGKGQKKYILSTLVCQLMLHWNISIPKRYVTVSYALVLTLRCVVSTTKMNLHHNTSYMRWKTGVETRLYEFQLTQSQDGVTCPFVPLVPPQSIQPVSGSCEVTWDEMMLRADQAITAICRLTEPPGAIENNPRVNRVMATTTTPLPSQEITAICMSTAPPGAE